MQNGNVDPRGLPLTKLIASCREQVESKSALAGPPRDVIPGYRLVREIHRGGQGVVYLAHQTSTQRDVAIKMMREGPFASVSERARFEREAHILASIKHPNIVAIHDSGNVDGNHYFVMDYIAGRSFDAWADQTRLGSRSTARQGGSHHSVIANQPLLETFVKVCDAVAVAHQRGVIHRDLKPSNIRVDGDAHPYVLDFGLAKSLVANETHGGCDHLTMTGQFVGTLPWSSPEQVAALPHLADVRTDVYALGLILYRSLTGQMPYRIDKGLTEMVEVISHQAPMRPSEIDRQIDSDLETIVLKCVQKEPDRRYQSAGELADDLRRYQRQQPILARPDSGFYTFRMFARRHRSLMASGIAFVGLLISATIVSSLLYAKAKRNERLADLRAQETQRVVEFQNSQLSQVDPELMGVRLLDQLRKGVMNSDPQSMMTTDSASLGDRVSSTERKSLAAKAPAITEDRLNQLESALRGVNLTDIGLKLLESNVFDPAIAAADSQFAEQPRLHAELLQNLADTLLELSLIDRAEVVQRKALTIRRDELSSEHDDTLASIIGLANLYRLKEKYREAHALLDEAIPRLTARYGEQHPLTLRAMSTRAGLLLDEGSHEESLVIQRAVFHGTGMVYGDNHPRTITSFSDLATTLQTMEQFDQALKYHELALAGQEKLFGVEHAATLSTKNNIAALYFQTGRYRESLDLYRDTMEGLRARLGDEHRQTVATRSNFARALLMAGEIDQAIRIQEKVLASRRKIQGELHSETLNSMSGLASAYARSGEAERAVELQREAVAGFQVTLGNDHPHTIRAVNGLALAEQGVGNINRAMELFTEAIEANRRTLGDDHSETLLAIGNLGVLLDSLKRHDEAVNYLGEAVDGFIRTLGLQHNNTNTFMRRYGTTLGKLGRHDKAVAILREASEACEAIYGDQAQTHNGRILLASALARNGRAEEALPHYLAAVAGYRRAMGEKHPYTLTAIQLAGELQEKLERWNEALAMFQEASAGRAELFGADDANTLASLAHVGLVQAELGESDAARATMTRVSGQMDAVDVPPELARRVTLALAKLNANSPMHRAGDGSLDEPNGGDAP